ncbi:MAG TPA: sugar phosphate isomerase/epimerase family protein [Armatimonadaceae bacterium]|nr:sugar phosphate isomerase/epimerase family protein [Armatimonadaceae bacterium]
MTARATPPAWRGGPTLTPTPAADDRLVISSCSLPKASLPEALATFADAGYRRFELFSDWAASRVDWRSDDPERIRALGAEHGMTFAALHLPRVDPGDRFAETQAGAVGAVRFAAAVGAGVVLLKAADIATYVRAAGPVLDAAEPLGVTVVVQNHFGTALERPEHTLAVLDGAGDPRLRSLLEVGQFHSAGVGWREAADALGESVVYVHVKDQVGRQSVAFGAGEIDLLGLFAHLENDRGYRGEYVIEMEVADPENTARYCREAREYVLPLLATHGGRE